MIEAIGVGFDQRSTRYIATGIVVGVTRGIAIGIVASTTRGTTTTREDRGFDRFGDLNECHRGSNG